MKLSFGNRRGGSCLVVLIILALVCALAIAVSRLNEVERVREDEKRAAEMKPVEKTPEQLKRERINEELSGTAPDLGSDPSPQLADGSLATLKSVRDKTVHQQAKVKLQLKTAEESLDRLRGERKQLEKRLAILKDEFERFPDDAKVGDDLAQCDEDLENKNREILHAQTDVRLLKEADYRMEREVAMLAAAIRRCEAEGRAIATTVEYEALKKELIAAQGAAAEIGVLRRNLGTKTMDMATEAEGEKIRKRERLQKYRKPTSETGDPK
ncbi:MAG: hypothetical protein J6Z49_02130 [Kiritimatiellae bacterium]|nr:hypothetical protein [Kiritimatiellia bacterium]